MIYVKFSASLLGCRILKMRYPHKKTITDTKIIDEVLGTFHGYAPYLPNISGCGYVTAIKKLVHDVELEFDKSDGQLHIHKIDHELTYKAFGDIRRYALEGDGWALKQSDIASVPLYEDDTIVVYKERVEYRGIELLATMSGN